MALELTSDDTKTEEDIKILEGIVKFGKYRCQASNDF